MQIDTKALKTAVGAVATQVDEFTIRPQEDGWHIDAMSPDHTSIICAVIPKEAFSPYEPCEPFALAVKDLSAPFRTSGDTMDLTVSEGRLTVSSEGMTYTRGMMPEGEVPKRIPDIEGEAFVMVEAGEAKRLVSAAEDVKDGVLRIKVNGQEASMESMDPVKWVPEASLDLAGRCIASDGIGIASYSLMKWAEFLKAVPDDAVLDMAFCTDYPVKVSYKADGRYSVDFVLAPRIDSREG